jgi:tetratricopeptide (TPR) repeat protein
MMKMISVIKWNFGRASGDAEMVDNPSKAQQGDSGSDAGHAKPTESSSKVATEGVPPQKAGIDQMVLLLKKNGMEKYDNEEYQAALADFDAACKLEPQCVFSLKYRGDIKYMLCQYEEALKDLTLASETEPNDWFTLSRRGAVYKALDDYENALEDLNRADELDANNHFIKTERGVVKRSLRDFAGALVDLSHAANACSPHQAYILMQLGVVKRELGQFHEALGYLNRAYELKSTDTFMELESNDAFLHRQRGVVRREVKDLEGALHDLNIAHRIVSDDAYTLRRRGITRRELLDCQGSLEDLNEANYLEPFNNLTLNERGVTKKVLGDFQGAIEDLTMANHIKADQAFTLKHRGSAYRELGNLVDALEDLSYANSLEPNDFFTLLELGMTKKLSHDYKGALINYNRVVEMEPNDPWILRERGSVRRDLKDFRGALEDLKKVEELQPKLYSQALVTVVERCSTKYAMEDIDGAREDAKMVRELWGEHGRSLIKGEQLKLATICRSAGPSESASSFSERLNDIETLTSSRYLLWIKHRKLLFLRDLGRGSYGYVQKCKWVDKNKDVAVKFVTSHIKDAFEYEVRILASIQHPRVVRLIGCSYNEEEKQGLLVMELMQQNLRSLIDSKRCENGQPFELPVAVDIMAKIAEAMEYLHEQGVLHRDLKSSNVLVNRIEDGKEEYVVKIADFGMARMQKKKNNTSFFMTVDVGATLWRAPEVFKNEEGSQDYSFPADVWSYGITCYEVLTGEVPFEGETLAQLRQNILCGLRPILPETCPGVLKYLLMQCWSLMPYHRPNFSDIHKILKLYLGTITSRDLCDHRTGDPIRPHELRRHIESP